LVLFPFQEFDLSPFKQDEKSLERLQDLLLQILNLPSVNIDLALISANIWIKLTFETSRENPPDFILETICSSNKSSFACICLTTACLNHVPCTPDLLEHLFHVVLKYCLAQTSHGYQNFQALRLWSLKSKQIKSNFLIENENQLKMLLDLLNANWENPLRGVPDLISDILTNILDTIERPTLNEDLLDSTLQGLSWKTKAKYPPLVILLPRVGVLATLTKYKDFGQGLGQSMISNHLSSAGAAIYR
jgi:hypothetical protein